MADPLTQDDIDYLSTLVGESFEDGVNNRDAYYTYPEERGYQYGELAGGVVREDSISGRIANAFMAATAASNGNAINVSQSLNISYDLMAADLESRRILVEQTGFAGELDARVHYDNHSKVFSQSQYGLSSANWTASEPIEFYSENFELLGFASQREAENTAMRVMMDADYAPEMIALSLSLSAATILDVDPISVRGIEEWFEDVGSAFLSNPLYVIPPGIGSPYAADNPDYVTLPKFQTLACLHHLSRVPRALCA